MADAAGSPSLGKRRSSARLAAAADKESSTMDLTGAMADLNTEAAADEEALDQSPTKVRKASVVGNMDAFAKFKALDAEPPAKSPQEIACTAGSITSLPTSTA